MYIQKIFKNDELYLLIYYVLKTIYKDYKYNKILHLWDKQKKKIIFISTGRFNPEQKSLNDKINVYLYIYIHFIYLKFILFTRMLVCATT